MIPRMVRCVLVGAIAFSLVDWLIIRCFGRYFWYMRDTILAKLFDWRFDHFGHTGGFPHMFCLILTDGLPEVIVFAAIVWAYDRIAFARRFEEQASRRPRALVCIAGFWLSVSVIQWALWTTRLGLLFFKWMKRMHLVLPLSLSSGDEYLLLRVLIATIVCACWLTVYALWTARPGADGGPRCRKCGYILRGLADNRCPECFTPFDPAASDHKPGAQPSASPPQQCIIGKRSVLRPAHPPSVDN